MTPWSPVATPARLQAGGAAELYSFEARVSGGTYIRALVRDLGAELGCEISVPAEPDTVGAYGAALIARERATRGRAAAAGA